MKHLAFILFSLLQMEKLSCALLMLVVLSVLSVYCEARSVRQNKKHYGVKEGKEIGFNGLNKKKTQSITEDEMCEEEETTPQPEETLAKKSNDNNDEALEICEEMKPVTKVATNKMIPANKVQAEEEITDDVELLSKDSGDKKPGEDESCEN